MKNYHITPGRNGWADNAKSVICAMTNNANRKHYAELERRTAEQRTQAELEYYDENGCFPRPLGYFGTETDAHFYER